MVAEAAMLIIEPTYVINVPFLSIYIIILPLETDA